MRRRTLLAAAGAAAAGLAGCSLPTSDGGATTTTAIDGSVELASPAFDGETVPGRYACTDAGGENVSPRVEVGKRPDGTAALALVLDDPDAGAQPFVHWLLYDVAGDRTVIPEGLPAGGTVLDGARHGTNDRGATGYFGPCPPPPDDPHTYRLAVVALDAETGLDPGADRGALADAIDGHVVGSGRVTATFDR